MRKFRMFLFSMALVLALKNSVPAGIIDCPAPAPPPLALATEPDDIWLPSDTEGPSVASPAGTDFALNLLQELLLVF